ncbi:MAG: hypothetical protein IJ188_01110 [Clostridia bacterium]|nr:hypothetical protein [Clostridia bacterium]
MRPVAIILLIICLGMIGFTGFLYFNANVVITDIDCIAVDAGDQAEYFQGLKDQIEAGTFVGTPFNTAEVGKAEEYQFYSYTVHVANDTFIKAEVAEVQVTPMNGDVLQLAEENARTIPARGKGTIQATILTKKEMHNVRELMVTYYLWGLPFSARVTYSE